MSVSLADCIPELPSSEIDRLQKRLRVILRHRLEARRLRTTLQSVFEGLGPPSRKLSALGPEALKVFQKLLDNFGMLSSGQFDSREREVLHKIPYVVWTDDEHCRLCEEAESCLARDHYFHEEGYLFSTIKSLPVKEKRAWAAWLQLNGNHVTGANLESELYAEMASSRRRSAENEPANSEDYCPGKDRERPSLPEFLHEVFPEDDTRLPVAWFYRGILPLYNALAETGKTAAGTLSPLQQKVLSWMKVGQVVAHAVAPDFGQPERYRLIWTREKSTPSTAATKPAPAHQEQLQL